MATRIICFRFQVQCPALLLVFVYAVVLAGMAETVQAQEASVNFNRDIRPLLSDRCFHCHGPDEEDRKEGLWLD